MDIRPYDPNHSCAPCGAEGATVRYHEQPILLSFGRAAASPCQDHPDAPPHLCARCGICGHAWMERPAPA